MYMYRVWVGFTVLYSIHVHAVPHLVYPHSEWVPVGDEEPLSHIKLCLIDEQWPLYVLLYHPSAKERIGSVELAHSHTAM